MQTRRLEFKQFIDEKVLQRYAFEKLCFSNSERRKLLPPTLRGLSGKFKVLIPEYPLVNPGYRADFRLLFKGSPAVNVEIEWATSNFHRHHGAEVAAAHYAGGKGFLIVLDDDREGSAPYLRSLDVVKIDPDEFSWWFDKNAKMLMDTTIAYHASEARSQRRRYWVVYLGRVHAPAMDDYMDKGRGQGIWAFRYAKGENLTNILRIATGDVVIFAGDWHVPGGRQIYPGRSWSCSRVDVFDVTHGYWCDFQDKTFERDTWNGDLDEKEYMHYFKFKPRADREYHHRSSGVDHLKGEDFTDRDIRDTLLCDALRMSNTQRGSPVPIGEEVFMRLRRRLA